MSEDKTKADKPAKSTKTTVAGVLAILAALLAAAQAHFDGDPTTLVNWGATATAVVTGIGLIVSRDFDVSSEGMKVVKKQAGAAHLGLLLGLAACLLLLGCPPAPSPTIPQRMKAAAPVESDAVVAGEGIAAQLVSLVESDPQSYVAAVGSADYLRVWTVPRDEDLVFCAESYPPPCFLIEPRGGATHETCDRWTTTRDGAALFTMHRNRECLGHRGDPGPICSDEVH